MFFESHAHYDASAFDEDREAVLSSLPQRGVSFAVNPGADLRSSRMACELSERFPFLYAAVGIHPEAAGEYGQYGLGELERLADSYQKVRAIGEIGLDYHYEDGADRSTQIECLEAQLDLARRKKLPVIIHERDACADCLDILRTCGDLRGVVHCFSGSWETARQILDLGWYLSFTGVITFKNARRALEVLPRVPADRLMIETDSPYMAPVPVRGTRNDSSNLRFIAEKAAELRGISVEELAALTLENGRRFFAI